MDTHFGDAQQAASPQRRHRAQAKARGLRLWNWGEAAWRDFMNLLLPADCAVCGKEDHAICPECSAVLRRQTRYPFRAEGAADALVGVLGQTHLPVVAAGNYRDALSASLLAYKNHGRTELKAQLCRCLARAMSAAMELAPIPPNEPVLLVPVPSTGSGWRRRGYDPVAMMLRALTREGRAPAGMTITPMLSIRAKLPWHRRHQKGLGREARRKNVRNTMRIRVNYLRTFRPSANPAGRLVVLVDDVLTTGSTLREAAKTLEESGFTVCAAVVLAATRAPDRGHEKVVAEGLAENYFPQKMNKAMQ
ncbi:comF family protein [Arthrobacter alpinus]|uniref:ComF family protein n=1 Tax=Arthrobacter alpinus TaxID=656366 RepID=A0A1H5E4R0_9MICC|nr:phosphoribosyltransferase family protein [Arthrobacter alpinus]SED86043.1 comF family protein [Arthrobacter alpinus]